MEITLGLQYREQAPSTVVGAFINGHSVAMWLAEINSWGIPMQQLCALLIPENKQSVTAAGLFVLFPAIPVTTAKSIRHPYQLLGNKLFIPVNATLTPALTPHELSGLLIWDWQVFHPSLGFNGFEEKDTIRISDLLALTAPTPSDWEYARMGTAPRIKLQRIDVNIAEKDPFAGISSTIGMQPLSALTDKATAQLAPASFLQKIQHLLMDMIGSKAGAGLFNRTDDVEEKRKRELERLLRMFEQDEATALQYALPLNNPYEGRGSADKGVALQKNNASFNLQGLGGGTPVDVWDPGNYRHQLRKKYELAAKTAISATDFKKAAYIYARLLGDFAGAANVLEQGGYYRDAAEVYKTHLDNPGAAARCLEKGGLLLEAIDLYKSLQQFEKAADLHIILDQREEAVPLYNRAAQNAIHNNDLLGAATIIRKKLEDIPRARQVLLSGWNGHIQTTACLQQYLELSGDHLVQEFHFIHKHHVPAALENNFLQVLLTTSQLYQQETITSTATDIAYEIISKQSLAGNTENLKLLNSFIPEDSLLQGDCNRFINLLPKPLPMSRALLSIRFAADVTWLNGAVLNGELVMIGVKKNGVYLLRYNLINHWEYALWQGSVPGHTIFTLMSDSRYSNRLMIHHHLPFELPEKVLKSPDTKGERFEDELLAGGAGWLPKGLTGYCFTEHDIVTLHVAGTELIFSRYTQEGSLKSSQHCILYGTTTPFALPPRFRQDVQELIYWYGAFYLFLGHSIYKLDFQRRLQPLLETDHIHHLKAGYDGDKLGIVAATEDSILWLTYTYGDSTPKVHGSIAENQAGTKVKYLPHQFIITYHGAIVQVYKIADNDELVHSHQIVADAAICAVESIPKKDHIAIMSENGALAIYDLQDNGSVE
jgi:tetratricopeptide (TPR) repeat protein